MAVKRSLCRLVSLLCFLSCCAPLSRRALSVMMLSFYWLGIMITALPVAGFAVLLLAFLMSAAQWYLSGAYRRPLRSCLYEGRVRHARFKPTTHSFNYPIFFAYIDLDELPQLQKLWPLFGYNTASVASLNISDHLCHDNTDKRKQNESEANVPETFQEKVKRSTMDSCGYQPAGAIRLLTHLRYWGYCFNPVSFYYLMKPAKVGDHGEELVDAMIAEVTNTPWIEMHCYILCEQNKAVQCTSNRQSNELHYNFAKNFHVSPFMDMDYVYEWTFSQPGDKMTAITNMKKGDELYFSAKFNLTRTEISPTAWLRVMVSYPFQTWMIQLYIHYEAVRLWVKSVPIYPHPHGTETTASRAIWHMIKPFYELHQYYSRGKADSTNNKSKAD